MGKWSTVVADLAYSGRCLDFDLESELDVEQLQVC